jgi:uncharacterized cupredoxin-like copper-binding protein
MSVFVLVLGCSGSDSSDEICEGNDCVDMMAMAEMDAGPEPDAAPEPEPDMGVGTASVSPERFEFSYVEPGEEQQQTVTLTNAGDGPLRLHDFGGGFSTEYRLYWQRGRTSAPLDEQEVGVEDGENTFPEDIEVMAGEAVQFTLVYRPTEDGQRGGAFTLTADRDLRFSIEHSDERPDFTVMPNPVEFGMVVPGETSLQFLNVANVGTAIATLEEVSISGSDAFSISIGGQDPAVNARALDNPDRDLEPGVGIGKEVAILIRFQPEDEMPATAEIRIVSDAVNGEIVVPILGNSSPD